MRLMITVTAALAVAYAGFWVIGRQDRIKAVAQLEQTLTDSGLGVRYGAIATRGFPSRFDTSATGLVLEGDDWRWEMPALEVAALSYRPGNLIATFPEHQLVVVRGREVTIRANKLRASAAIDGTGGVLALTLEANGLNMSGVGEFDRILIALRQREGTRYDAYAELSGGRLDGQEVATAKFEGVIDLGAELSGAAELPDLADVVLLRSEGDWNGHSVTISGRPGSVGEATGPGAPSFETALATFLNGWH